MEGFDIAVIGGGAAGLSQINRKVADECLRQPLTPARKRWLKRLFGLRGSA